MSISDTPVRKTILIHSHTQKNHKTIQDHLVSKGDYLTISNKKLLRGILSKLIESRMIGTDAIQGSSYSRRMEASDTILLPVAAGITYRDID